MATRRLRFESYVEVTPAEAWAWVTSMKGISTEMHPYLRMTAPPGVTGIADLAFEPGMPLFRGRLLLGGVLPVGWTDLTLRELEPGRRFVEESPMSAMRQWRHERRIVEAHAGVDIIDQLDFEPRFGGWLTEAFVRRLFEHRHSVLRRALTPSLGGRASREKPA
ncbi:hypothetical protein [Corallococcus macrosporus]|uniref:Polyketide cyclase n=1 Tax=Corallococcus macrosporus DSM 14697 TaxID=1189310 RepID=A0A250JP24_9BACT|nr:hypothetical protein [Corallococcus macrosporus]ATB45619.1 hypothetical protein MYMAC_001204 [Corallococcus macrosporus DSM 14697]